MSEWISVKDELPSKFGWFLVLDKSLTGKQRTVGFFEGEPDFMWLPLDDRDNSDSMIITHWMPIPEPPADGNK